MKSIIDEARMGTSEIHTKHGQNTSDLPLDKRYEWVEFNWLREVFNSGFFFGTRQ
jgi:hypothetical protein